MLLFSGSSNLNITQHFLSFFCFLGREDSENRELQLGRVCHRNLAMSLETGLLDAGGLATMKKSSRALAFAICALAAGVALVVLLSLNGGIANSSPAAAHRAPGIWLPG